MNRQDYIDDSRLNMAYVLIQGGMYKEASDILQNINRATLAEYLERYYFLIYNTLYEAMVKYTIIESQSKEYRAKAMLYKDSIMQKMILPMFIYVLTDCWNREIIAKDCRYYSILPPTGS